MRLITCTCLCLLLFPWSGYGQLFMAADHYVNNPMIINPAYAGSENALSVMMMYRNNWTGFEGSPKTMSIAAHAPVFNANAGLGLVLLSDRIGISKETNLTGNYAYRIIFDKSTLAFGLGFSLTFQKTEWDKLRPADPDDQLLVNIPEKGVIPDFSTGIYYSNDRFFLSLSAPMFLDQEYDYSGNRYRIKNDISNYNYFANTGYLFDIRKDIKVLPTVMVKYCSGITQYDIGSSIQFRKKISFGALYRSRNILAGMFQFQVNNQLKIGYSYDFNFSYRTNYRYNSNEITLRYVFEYLADVPDPREF